MINVRLIKPKDLPPRIAGIAVLDAEDVEFMLRDDLTPCQIAEWVGRLGRRISVGGPYGPRGRSTPITE